MSVQKSMSMTFSAAILFLAAVLPLAGCATLPKPQACILPGKELQTLQSSVSIAVKTGEKSTGGRGYLVYQRPDRFHLLLLSPFGQSLFEVFMIGDRITCLVPSKDAAYTGLVSELPDANPLKNWGLMRWATERPPAEEFRSGVRECKGPDGHRQLVTYDKQGLVTEKENEEGDRVLYGDYEAVNGVALPKTVELLNRRGDEVRIVFDELEVNQPVEATSFAPNLEGLTVLPLAAFQGV
jgi:outer membrane biogenesis lipoprotein LolB